MYSAFMVLPIYLTTDKRAAEHYALARAASDGDTEYAVIGLRLAPHAVEKDDYSAQEPDQFLRRKPIHLNTFYSRNLVAEVASMPTDEMQLVYLKAYCVGMAYGDDRHLAPAFKHLLR